MNKIICGDSRDILRMLPDKIAQTVITSPPYWGLRDYGLEPIIWDGDVDCEHEWGDVLKKKAGGGQPGEKVRWQHVGRGPSGHPAAEAGQFCRLCGAWLGSLGLEPTPDCGRPFMELRDDLTEKEQDFVIEELLRLGILDKDPRDNKPR